MKQPLVSIIILTYKNGLSDIKKCFESLYSINYKRTEIILVDNFSTDDTVSYVKKKYPLVKIIENKKNLGFCKGNNQAFKFCKGEYILFFNNDAVATKDFLDKLVDSLEKNKNIGAIQPKIIQLKDKNKLDACVSFLTPTGFLYHYGYSQNQNLKKYNKNLFMYTVKGACFLTRASLIKRIGLFDDDYFAYFEETDFCHRVWLSGKQVLYEPKSVVFHLGGVGKKVSPQIQYFSYKNRLETYIKNFEKKTLMVILPLHLVLCILIALVYSFSGNFGYSLSILKSILYVIFNFDVIMGKRFKVQSSIRIKKDTEIFKFIFKNPSVFYYKHLFFSPRKYYDFKEI